MSIVTRTGDDGHTGLYGAPRVSKASPRIHAYGTVDELNSLLGLVLATHPGGEKRRTQLTRVQQLLFRVGCDLCTPLSSEAPVPRMETSHVAEIEGWIKELEAGLPVQRVFILPGGSHAASLLHVARTVCRRAERHMVELMAEEDITKEALKYINRLSDYLFILARQANAEEGVGDVGVNYGSEEE